MLNLQEIFIQCVFGNAFQVSATIPKHWIEVIADDSALEESSSWDNLLKLNIRAPFLPLYVIILQCSGSRFRSADARLVRETCACDGGPPQTPLYDFIKVINNGQDGMQSLARLIRAEKRNFDGKKLVFCNAKFNAS